MWPKFMSEDSKPVRSIYNRFEPKIKGLQCPAMPKGRGRKARVNSGNARLALDAAACGFVVVTARAVVMNVVVIVRRGWQWR